METNRYRYFIYYSKKPEEIAQAFILGKDFIDNKPNVLILGDNIFHVQI